MRFPTVLTHALSMLYASMALAHVPAKSPNGANRHWASGSISIRLTGPTIVDGNAVHDDVRNAIASWNAIAHAGIAMTAVDDSNSREPAIGNGSNEFGWVESSDNPYFIPGVPCTTATIYDTLTGVVAEADTTCNALAFQWPDDLFGLYTQDGVVDAESAALAAFGTWLGLDTSLQYGDPMAPSVGSGMVLRFLVADEFAFGRHQYGDGSSPHGAIGGTVRFADGSPIPYANVLAIDGQNVYGAVAGADGNFTIAEAPTGSYRVVARPLTTDPYVVSSVPYRANPIRNLDFTPAYYEGGLQVQVWGGSMTLGIDIVVTRSGSQPDAHEPNDAAASAAPLSLGFSSLATTHDPLDSDWYWFQTAANTCYVVATAFHGASTVPTTSSDAFWSRTRLTIYDGPIVVGQNESRNVRQSDPRSWLTICETGSGRRLDVKTTQRAPVGGAGFFYIVFVQDVAGGSALTPRIDSLYPTTGWSNRNRFVWIEGADFMPGARVDIRLPGASWVAASEVVASGCDSAYRCRALEALFPSGTPGLADVRITNPNGRTDTKFSAFTYLANTHGPIDDLTPQAFGTRYGHGQAVCVGDYDGDGSDDILKTRNGFLPNQLFRSDAIGAFSDVAASAGFQPYPSVFGKSCSFVDVDDDGDLDAYITNVAYTLSSGSANDLYVNRLADDGHPTFVRDTAAGLSGVSTRYQSDAAWADYDRDGRLDVVLAYDSYAGSAPYPNALRYLRQGADESFADATGSSGLTGYVASVTSVTATDFNDDGCEDLAVFTSAGLANRFYRGDCDGSFTDYTSQSRIALGSPWCTGIAVADFNNDSKPDIFCGTYNTGGGAIRPRLWLNNGNASFTDRALEAGLYTVARNMDVALPLDEDNDGRTDVYLGASESGWLDDRKDVLLQNTGGNPPNFVDITDAASMYPTTQDGSGICVAGVDEFYCDRDAVAGGVLDRLGDGSLDVFVTGADPDFLQRGSDFLWANRGDVLADGSTALGNDWIEVALKGANTRSSRVLSNRFGIGARVTVVPRFTLPGEAVPTETQCLQHPLPAGVVGASREVVAGNRSQSSTVLHFGLGSATPFGRKRVDCIKVEWPSGFERAYTGVPANTKVVLAEDSGRMKVIKVIPNSGLNTQSNPTTITGLRFDRDVVSFPQVYFGAVPAASVSFVSEHELTVFPPLWQPPGAVDVTVVNTDGEHDTLLSGYSFTGANAGVRFKDPVPSMIAVDGAIPNDPDFVATRGIDRTGVIADGLTALILEAEVGVPGRVRFELDDDDIANNAAPPGTSVGTATGLGGGAPVTSLTVPVTLLSGGRYVAQAVYRAPQTFVRSTADHPLATRPIRVRSTFIDTADAEHAMPARSLVLHRVPVLYVHGMWGDTGSFGWPIMSDSRFIIHRADYSATNDLAFDQNSGMAPRVVAELRKKINDIGIAGTRFFVIGHSMGAVLFKIYMAGAGAAYARADNFYGGDVYALVSVDAPFFGSYFASHILTVRSTGIIGPLFTQAMRSIGLAVDRGCMESLDPLGPDIRDIPTAVGAFHAIVGWGGGEMRDAGAALASGNKLALVRSVLSLFDFEFENFIVQCGSGDDFIVCTDSQQGGLSAAHVSDFHFQNLTARAIHLDSICKESLPSATVEQLLNTPTTTGAKWGPVLPAAPLPSAAEVVQPAASTGGAASIAVQGNDGISLTLAKQGSDAVLTWNGAATRMLKSLGPSLGAAVCVAVSGSTTSDAHALTVPTTLYYAVGVDSLCVPGTSLSIASMSPASGSAMGGYSLTILGTGFDASTRVRIGEFYASQVVVASDTLLTCRVMPGAPGETTITITNSSGQIAAATFTYIDPGPIPGGVAITAPAEGAVVTAGSTITVSAVGWGGYTVSRALVTAAGFSSSDDRDAGDDFATELLVPADVIGPITIELLAKDASGNFKRATPVTIAAVAPGNLGLVRLDAEKITLLFATPSRQLRVYGIYTDGTRREVTHAPGILYEMDTQDPRKPNYPYNGTGVAVVDTTGVITAKTQGRTLCHVSYNGLKLDVVVEVAAIRPTVTLQNPGFISWPYQGLGITYDVVRGKLSGLRATGGIYADPSTGITCIKDDFVNVTAADVADPPPEEGYFYLMRDSLMLSYEESPFWTTRSQIGQRTTEIDSAPNGCP